ncbi:MAG: hypothetical protein Q9199_005793, partial [Rusavskia elegans]
MALMVRPMFRPPRHFLPPVHLHLYSFGITIGTPTLSLPVLLGIDLRDLISPPQELCYWFTGKDPEIQAAFWSFREHELIYRAFLSQTPGSRDESSAWSSQSVGRVGELQSG